MHILSQLNIGGAELLVLNFLKRIDKNKFTPFVCTFDRGGSLEKKFKENNIPVLIISKEKGIDFRLFYKLYKIVSSKKIDIIHTHNFQPWFYAGMSKVLCKNVRLIHTEHSNLKRKQNKAIFAEKILSRISDRVIGVSNKVSDTLVEITNNNNCIIETILNGIPTDDIKIKSNKIRDELRIDNKTKIIGSVGRLVEDKDYSTLIRAFKIFLNMHKHDNFVLLLVGDGSQRKVLEELGDSLGISDRIIFSGFREDVYDFYGAFDAFVLSSIDEGLPLSLLEAMACEVPVISSRVGGIPELICEGETGLLFNPGDIEDLVGKLEEMFCNDKVTCARCIRAKELVLAEYSIESMIAKYLTIYNESMGRQCKGI